MSWRKLDDDGKGLCRSLDHILDGVQAIKDSIQRGQRIDGEGEMKVDFKGIWCPELLTYGRSLTDASLDVEETKASLRRMKDVKNALSSLLESIDETIESVAKITAKDLCAAGLASLPEDMLAIIFEMYVDMYEFPDYKEDFVIKYPALVISSICQRFRQLALRLPDLWKLASHSFPAKILQLHKERCPNPILRFDLVKDSCNRAFTFSKTMDVIHPSHQWRELHLHLRDGEYIEEYLEGLGSMIGQNALEALEYLSICNDLSVDPVLEEEDSWLSIYLPKDQSPIISSWQMPNLTHLKLRNILPHPPLQCENVTWFSFEIRNVEEPLRLEDLQRQLQSLPRMQTLSMTISITCPFDSIESSKINHSPLTPSLTNLELRIRKNTPDIMVAQILALVNTQQLTRFKLNLEGHVWKDSQFDEWVNVIFPETARAFANVEHFSLDSTHFRGTRDSFGRIFTSLPSVQEVSLVLPNYSNIEITDYLLGRGALRRLRSLVIEVVQMRGYSCPLDINAGNNKLFSLFKSLDREEFERLEVRNRSSYSISEGKASLQRNFGEKLHWIDYQTAVADDDSDDDDYW